MSKSDHKALDELRTLIQTRQIRISRADKGGAIVIQDMDSYLQEAHRQLDNMTHYVMINNDPTYQIAKQTNLIIRDLHDNKLIDRNTFQDSTQHMTEDCVSSNIIYLVAQGTLLSSLTLRPVSLTRMITKGK